MHTWVWLKLYLFSLVLFLVVDMVWLGLLARSFYRQQLQELLSPQVNWAAALLFYLLYLFGLLFFAVRPGLESGSPGRALLLGALFGLVTYATYDLTNLATLRGWPVQVTVVDIAWGAVLCALVSGAACRFGLWLQHGG